ncbi:MAG: CDP-alcohol phosphatidyltransferase family protein [Clostridiaceae bacterium]|nr:CDP-alcohol phosphatidyltransferase family protein [Clostridiaceae bacterium]
MNIPNTLTTIRFFLIPVLGYFLYQGYYIWSVIILGLSGLTDILDGFFARKLDMITSWGKFADPLADKLTQLTTLAVLCIKNKIHLIIIVIILLKEILMGIGSLLLYRQDNIVVSSNWYGKMATVILYFSVILVIFDVPHASVLVTIAVVSSLFSLFMYMINFFKIKASLNREKNSDI